MNKINNKMTSNQKFKIKMKKLDNKRAKIAGESKATTLTAVTREAGKAASNIATTIATNRTAQATAKYNRDKEVAKYNMDNIESSLKAYNDAISGNPNSANGSNGTSQGGSTTSMGSSYGR